MINSSFSSFRKTPKSFIIRDRLSSLNRFYSVSSREQLPDYYRILGIPPNADKKQIKQSFFSLSLKYHPDRSSDPNSKTIYLKITEAYSTLYDDAKRREYDKRRFAGNRQRSSSYNRQDGPDGQQHQRHQHQHQRSSSYNDSNTNFSHQHDFWSDNNYNHKSNSSSWNPRQYSRRSNYQYRPGMFDPGNTGEKTNHSSSSSHSSSKRWGVGLDWEEMERENYRQDHDRRMRELMEDHRRRLENELDQKSRSLFISVLFISLVYIMVKKHF